MALDLVVPSGSPGYTEVLHNFANVAVAKGGQLSEDERAMLKEVLSREKDPKLGSLANQLDMWRPIAM